MTYRKILQPATLHDGDAPKTSSSDRHPEAQKPGVLCSLLEEHVLLHRCARKRLAAPALNTANIDICSACRGVGADAACGGLQAAALRAQKQRSHFDADVGLIRGASHESAAFAETSHVT